VGTGPWDGLLVGSVPGTVAKDTPGVDGMGEGIGPPENIVAQATATSRTAMPNAAATTGRQPLRRFLFRVCMATATLCHARRVETIRGDGGSPGWIDQTNTPRLADTTRCATLDLLGDTKPAAEIVERRLRMAGI
jgi:hypothetical protein